jgi:hypothetical protein
LTSGEDIPKPTTDISLRVDEQRGLHHFIFNPTGRQKVADNMTDAQGAAAPGMTETKDELIKDALVKTGELGDGALDQVAGGIARKAGGTQLEYLKVVKLTSVFISS